MTNILLLKNLKILRQKILSQDQHKQKLATKADIDDFVKKTDFADKLKNLSKKII